jgi:hypothetical protein
MKVLLECGFVRKSLVLSININHDYESSLAYEK